MTKYDQILTDFLFNFWTPGHRRNQVALGDNSSKNPRLAEQQKLNRIDKREVNDICDH